MRRHRTLAAACTAAPPPPSAAEDRFEAAAAYAACARGGNAPQDRQQSGAAPEGERWDRALRDRPRRARHVCAPAARQHARHWSRHLDGGRGGEVSERPRRVLAHQRVRDVERTREHVGVVARPDVAQHHGGVALQPPELCTLHRRAPERRRELILRHA